MQARSIFLALGAFLLPGRLPAEELKLRCTADTALSSYESEREFNFGRSSRLRLKGIQSLAILDFDTAPIKSWRVQKATLYLRYATADRKLKTLGISSVSAPWQEGTGAGERKPGEVCFAWREQGKARWAGPQTDFTDVSFTAGNTISGYADLRDAGSDWIAVDVPPRIVELMAAGVSYGLAVTDEKGQTTGNNDVYSREQSGSEPYLVVQGAPAPAFTSNTAEKLTSGGPDAKHADFDHGALVFSAGDSAALAYELTYSESASGQKQGLSRAETPLPAMPRAADFIVRRLKPSTEYRVTLSSVGIGGARREYISELVSSSPAKSRPAALAVPARPAEAAAGVLPPPSPIRVWAYPETEKAHPISGNLLEETGLTTYAGAPMGDYRDHNSVWDGSNVRLFGARGETLGFNLVIEPIRLPAKVEAVRVAGPFRSADGRPLNAAATVSREWYVKDGEWVPDICVPAPNGFTIPSEDNGVQGQKNQAVFVELTVPKSAPPGAYRGELEVIAEGAKRTIPILLTVNALTLADRLGFEISLNAYGTVGHLYGIDDRTPAYRELEQAYHRLAHLHRATFAPLGYSHSGRISTNYAPPIEGNGANARVADWSAWDAQFGPLLDGSAFNGLPRDGVPVSHFYLTFSEAWPADIRTHYHYEQTVHDYPALITEHALKAPPIDQALDAEYAATYEAITKQFAQHFREKGWNSTEFQVYFNDKNYYKDPKQGSGQGTSWWLLDEPNYRDDWLALAYYGRLTKAGKQGVSGPRIDFREDVSRPQWQRDYLDGLVDLMVVSDELYKHGPRLRAMQEKWPVRFWNYGSANAPKRSNLEMEAWALRAWLAGADGIVPWQTVGSDANYTRPEDTALLLPGKRFGVNGPLASLRLKALRRAQQDAEYLRLLATAKGWDRDQVAAAVAGLLKLDATFEQQNAEDAGRYHFGPLRAQDFTNLRQAISAALAAN